MGDFLIFSTTLSDFNRSPFLFHVVSFLFLFFPFFPSDAGSFYSCHWTEAAPSEIKDRDANGIKLTTFSIKTFFNLFLSKKLHQKTMNSISTQVIQGHFVNIVFITKVIVSNLFYNILHRQSKQFARL